MDFNNYENLTNNKNNNDDDHEYIESAGENNKNPINRSMENIPFQNTVDDHTKTINDLEKQQIYNVEKSFKNDKINNNIKRMESSDSGDIKTRNVLWFLIFTGMAVNYMVIINISIALVDMIRQPIKTFDINNEMEPTWYACNPNNNYNNNNNLNFTTINTTTSNAQQSEEIIIIQKSLNTNRTFTFEHMILNFLNINFSKNGFEWDETEQNLVMGGYFWLHWITQIPGGILANKYGTKLVFGLSNLLSFALCFLIPIAAYFHIYGVVGVRILQGLIAGVSWPSMHNLIASWVPPNERSKFVTAYLGTSASMCICLPIFGYIITISSWEWVFHLSGVLGCVWYIFWQYYVYDSPALHPRITMAEKKYIETSLENSVQNTKRLPTPWKHIFTSRPVWMIILAQSGAIWAILTLSSQMPTYFKIIHGWSVQMTSIISGVPHLLRIIFAYSFSLIGDFMLRTNRMSRTNVRKLATLFFCIINGLFLILLAHANCNSTVAVIFLLLATAVHGAVSTGPLAGMVDISPNYASILLGITSLIGVLPGFISPYIVGRLTLDNQTPTQWKYVFLLTSFILIIPGLLYIVFADSNLQKWNNPDNYAVNKDDNDGENEDSILMTPISHRNSIVASSQEKNAKET